MMKIAEMYKRSGGTDYTHRCSECRSFLQGKKATCLKYPGEIQWKGTYTACRFFETEDEEQLRGQMNIFDLL